MPYFFTRSSIAACRWARASARVKSRNLAPCCVQKNSGWFFITSELPAAVSASIHRPNFMPDAFTARAISKSRPPSQPSGRSFQSPRVEPQSPFGPNQPASITKYSSPSSPAFVTCFSTKSASSLSNRQSQVL